MAHSLQAKKRVRQNEKRRLRNKSVSTILKNELKNLDQTLHAKKIEESAKLVTSCQSKADKAAKKGVIHKNKASRIKSRLTRKLNKAKAE